MNVSDAFKRAVAGVKRRAGLLTGADGSPDGNKGFICVACHSTYERQHYQCPQCGEMVLVPLNADETDPPREGPG